MGSGKEGLSVSAVLGHNASKWLAEALNRQHVKGYHQRLFKMCGFKGWQAAFKYQLNHPIDAKKFQPYWSAVESDIKKGYDVVDTNIWPSYAIPTINNYYPLKYVLYVTRNGIKWLYSVTNASSYRNRRLDHFGIDTYLQQYWEILGRPFKLWKHWTYWERLCLYWSTSYHMPKWLEAQGIAVYRYRMEDLVGGVELYELYDLFGIDIEDYEVLHIQQRNVNQHITSKYVSAIWKNWSATQIDTFKQICGDGMDYYDYSIL